jgi:hypothetical protein
LAASANRRHSGAMSMPTIRAREKNRRQVRSEAPCATPISIRSMSASRNWSNMRS